MKKETITADNVNHRWGLFIPRYVAHSQDRVYRRSEAFATRPTLDHVRCFLLACREAELVWINDDTSLVRSYELCVRYINLQDVEVICDGCGAELDEFNENHPVGGENACAACRWPEDAHA